MDDLKWFFIALGLVGVAGFGFSAVKARADGDIAIEACKAGLVQQVVKVLNYPPEIIWVKGPAAPLFEKAVE